MRWGAGGVVTVISRVLWIVSIAACSSITGCGGLRRCPITGGELHVWTLFMYNISLNLLKQKQNR